MGRPRKVARRSTRGEIRLAAFHYCSDYMQKFIAKYSRPGFRMPMLQRALEEEVEPERLRLLAQSRNGGLDNDETE